MHPRQKREYSSRAVPPSIEIVVEYPEKWFELGSSGSNIFPSLRFFFHPHSWERAVTLIVHRMAVNLTRISAIYIIHPSHGGSVQSFRDKNTFELVAFCAKFEINCLDPRRTLIRFDIVLFRSMFGFECAARLLAKSFKHFLHCN